MQFHTRKECRYGTDSNSTEGLPESGNSVNISAPICPQSEEGTKKSDGSDKSEDFLTDGRIEFFEGLSWRQIAKRSGVRVATVRRACQGSTEES